MYIYIYIYIYIYTYVYTYNIYVDICKRTSEIRLRSKERVHHVWGTLKLYKVVQ